MLKFFYLLLISCMLSIAAFAQTGTIRGIVVDSADKKPLAGCTVTVLEDGSRGAAAMCNSSGEFNIKFNAGVKSLALVITHVGYRKVVRKITENKSADINTGIISLAEGTVLKDVTIKAAPPRVKYSIGKTTLSLDEKERAKYGDVTQALRMVPQLTVTQENGVAIKGEHGVTLSVNGQKTNLSGQQMLSALQAIPINKIIRVEILSGNDERGDAQGGRPAILNVITTDRNMVGYFTTVSGTAGIRQGQLYTSTSLRLNKLSGIITLGDNYNKALADYYYNNEYTNNAVLASAESRGSKTHRQHAPFARLSMAYNIDTANTLTLIGGYGSYIFNDDNAVQQRERDVHNIISNYAGTYNSHMLTNIYSTYADYTHAFKNKAIFTLGYLFNTQNDNTDYHNKNSKPTLNYSDTLNTKSVANAAQADYSQTIGKVQLAAGVKYTNRHNTGSASYTGAGSGIDATENVYAFYASLQRALTPLVSAKIGLRAEKYDMGSRAGNGDFSYNLPVQLYPNLRVVYNVNKHNSLLFKISSNTQRPSLEALAPYANRSDLYSYTRGNPALRPERYYYFEGTYTLAYKVVSFTVQPYYTFTRDAIAAVVTTQGSTVINTYNNIGAYNTEGLTLGVNMDLSKITLYANGDAMYVNYRQDNKVVNSGWQYNTSAGFGWNIAKGLSAAGTFSYVTPGIRVNGQSSASRSTELSITKRLLKNRMRLTAFSEHFFKQEGLYINRYSGAGYSQYIRTQNKNFTAGIRAGFSFGKQKYSQYITQGISIDDVKLN